MFYVFSLIISYLLGSIPFGLIIAKFFNKGDIRKVGSGNIGATNVMRVGGLRMAGLVWLLDMAKAIVAVLIGRYVGGEVFAVWCGFAAIIGHCFPIWLGFQGGKGVSALFGVLLAINPILFIICGIEWLIVALGSGYSSAGACIVFLLMPVLGFVIGWGVGIGFLAISLLCIWRHRENILRLVSGKESKVQWKWKK
jgi:glycerol-3-phosphate acyltransferase PlsY